MKRFLTFILSIFAGIAIGIAISHANQETRKTSNVTVHVGDFLNKTQAVSYSTDKLPTIRVNQASAIRKFKSLYSNAVIKSISLMKAKSSLSVLKMVITSHVQIANQDN